MTSTSAATRHVGARRAVYPAGAGVQLEGELDARAGTL
jgi:hypothetical protein